MKLRVKKLGLLAGRPVCMIHEKTARELNLHLADRVVLKNKVGKELVCTLNLLSKIVKPHEIIVSREVANCLHLKNKDKVTVTIAHPPSCMNLIKKKLKGERLTRAEIHKIVENIQNNSLTEAEVAFFISAVYDEGMTLSETKHLTEAMVDSGNQLKLRGRIGDKHCIGGIAGNRTTPLVVAICAAAGLIIPKTSSRAITSAAGTADTLEIITKVNFSISQIKKIIKKTNACLVWGGALGLAPVDDKIIRIERIVNVDSTAQLLASILSKKISVGSKYILIDIPYGKSAKVSKPQAKDLKEKFLAIARLFDLELKVVLTDGREPIGRGVGPYGEIKDIISILKQENGRAMDLEEKSVYLSGKLLELAGIANPGMGITLAKKILVSKKALKKFKDIVSAQGGSLRIKKPKSFAYVIKSQRKIKIKHLNNKLINNLAKVAGCPEDKFSGLYLNKKKDETAIKGETILTIYSQSKEKLNHAKKFYRDNKRKIIETY